MQKTLAIDAPFRFDDAVVSAQPFPHFEAADFFDAHSASALLAWLEKEARWHQRKLDGYLGYSDISLFPEDLPRELDSLLLPETFSCLRSGMARLFAMEREG